MKEWIQTEENPKENQGPRNDPWRRNKAVGSRPCRFPREEADKRRRPAAAHMWSLRRVAKLQLLVASCGTPIAWSKFIEGETPHAVLRFLTVVHAQLGPSFPSYIAYDRACDVLREAVLAPTSTTSRNPFETPKRRRDNAPPPLPSFLESSRLVVTGFHQQCHTTTDQICRSFCNSIPLDGSAPDLVIPYVSSSSSRRRDRVFERAFNTSVSSTSALSSAIALSFVSLIVG